MTLVPSAVVTVTLTTPPLGDEPAGETTVALVEEFTVTLEDALVPKSTAMPLAKPVPLRATEVPPGMGPLLGLTPVTVGGASYVYRSALFSALVPCEVVTVTFTMPLPAGAVAVMLVEELTTTFVA